MGLKFRRFKAKLNWKQKTKVPEIVCLRYHITSEFSDELPRTPPQILPRTPPQPLPTNTNSARQHLLINEKFILAEKLKSMEVNNELDQKKISPLELRLKESSNSQSNADNETVSQPPKSILKKNTNSPNLEENKKSPLIFMTENHDDNEEEPGVKQVRGRRESVEENEYVQFQTNVENSDNKIVNWRETIEFISIKDNPTFSMQSQDESEDEIDGTEQDMYYENGNSYSNQAASIFFSRGDSKPNQNNNRV